MSQRDLISDHSSRGLARHVDRASRIVRSDPIQLAAERDRYREALEWIRHQCGVSTVDDAVSVMNEAYETASRALDEEQHRG